MVRVSPCLPAATRRRRGGLVQLAGQRLELGFGFQRYRVAGLAHPLFGDRAELIRQLSLTLAILLC